MALIGEADKMKTGITLNKRIIKDSFVESSEAQLNGTSCLRVVKGQEKLNDYDENTYAKIVGTNFHNGTIEVRVCSRLLPDAPDLARGFIGIAFRINEDDSAFESWYIRPTNGHRMTQDPVRLSHGTQYISYPTYTFAWFREHGISKYDSQADIALEEWITLRAVIHDAKGSFYVNDMETPVLVVEDMIHGADARGSIGLFVDIGTEGFFRDLTINYED